MKKKVNIILLVIVVILWGVVIYRYVEHYFLADPLPVSTYTDNAKYAKYVIKKRDTFTPKLTKRDPFLGNIGLPTRNRVSYTNTPKRIIAKDNAFPKKRDLVVFPLVRYYGFIKAAEQKDEVILMSVDGKFVRLKLRQDLNGLSIVQYKKDSVEVSFKKERKWFVQVTR